MRGGVSLAAALAIPLTVDGGGPFPDRDLIIFLTFAVIVATLVIQGLTLPAVVRALGLEEDGLDAEEELHARVQTARRARERVEELSGEEWVNADTAVRLRGPVRVAPPPLQRPGRRGRRRVRRALGRLPAAAARDPRGRAPDPARAPRRKGASPTR